MKFYSILRYIILAVFVIAIGIIAGLTIVDSDNGGTTSTSAKSRAEINSGPKYNF